MYRAGALSDPQVAAYFQNHFVAAYQQVGAFEVVDQHGNLQRNGGNVASYFCTPQGRVVHAVTGPVPARELLDEAYWAVDSYAQAASGAQGEIPTLLARSHERAAPAARRGTSNTTAIHKLLANQALPHLGAVYQEVFEKILGQRVSLPGEGIESVVEAVAAAKRDKLPVLFVLHKGKTSQQATEQWNRLMAQDAQGVKGAVGRLSDPYVVVTLPLNLMPAVSQRLKLRPYAAPDKGSPLFVVARPDGRQLTAVTGWDKPGELAKALALGLVQEAKEQPRTAAQLTKLASLVESVDDRLAADVRRLLVKNRLSDHGSPIGKKLDVTSRQPVPGSGGAIGREIELAQGAL